MYRLRSLHDIDWGPVLRALAEGGRFTLTTHVRPDTDGIGSELALCHHLRRRGKEAVVLNPDTLPDNLAFLDPDGAVRAFRPDDVAYVESSTIVVLDVSEPDRLGPMSALLARHRGVSICIDHHLCERPPFATHQVIEAAAPSTGVLIAELLQAGGFAIDPLIAQAIYATIVADTGSFRFSNTTADVMRLAADLVDLGADPQQTHRAVLGAYSLPRLRLLAEALGGIGFECDGQLAWFAISRELMERAGASEADIEGIVEYLRIPRGVRAAILFLEQPDRRVKLSLRSAEGLDVNCLAMRWGGGGHRHAAGAVVPGDLSRAVKETLAVARESLFSA